MSDGFRVLLLVTPKFLEEFDTVATEESREKVFPDFSNEFLERFVVGDDIPLSGFLLPNMKVGVLNFESETSAKLAIKHLPVRLSELVSKATAEWELPKVELFQ